MNRIPFRPATVGTLAIATLLAACDAAPGRQYMSIGTGGTGGIYYVLGGALASELSRRDSLRQYTAEVTGASVENVNRVRAGQLDLGIAMALTAYEAFHGGLDYDEPVTDLRIIAPLYPNITNVMIARGSGIDSLPDLRGRTVSVGSPGSGTEQLARQLLEAAGLSYEDIDVRYLTFSESASAIADGAIDAAIIAVGYPAAAVLEATTTAGARLIPVRPVVVDSLRARHPYYETAEIPAGVYRGVDAPVPTVSMMNWIVAREDLPDDVVRHVLDLLADDLDALVRVHEMARQIDLGLLRSAPIPLHPAVETWLAERGR